MTKSFTKTNDSNIREMLKSELQNCRSKNDWKMVEEMSIGHGSVRIDIAVINQSMIHGYEIKSDLDTLERLPKQIKKYNDVFDKITLVVGKLHLVQSIKIIPNWWGIKVAIICDGGVVNLHTIRESEENREQDAVSIAQLLWKEEALSALEERNRADGVRSKRREYIHRRFSEALDFKDLKNFVRKQCLTRENWRPVAQQAQYDD